MKMRTGFVSNSSSSSFICYELTMPPDEAKKILKKMLRFYNKMFGTRLQFRQVFKEPFFADEDYVKFIEEWDQWHCKLGDLVIESKEDNSIPSGLFDLIEEKFNAVRVHLG